MPHLYEVIRRPVTSERNTDLMADGRYTFEVAREANKLQIKEAVEARWEVRVKAVNTLNVHRKRRREKTRFRGYRSGWKKAIVTLVPGDRITEFFENV